MAQKRSCSGECRGHRREYCLVLLQIQRISSVKSVREVQTPSGKNASISECTPEPTNPRRGSVRKGGRRVYCGYHFRPDADGRFSNVYRLAPPDP